MRRKKDGLLTQNRERMGTGTTKKRKKEGVFDRFNEKHLPTPSKKTSWEISFFLLKMPAAATTPPAKKSLVPLHTTTSHITIILSYLTFIKHQTYPLLSISPSHLSSLFLFSAH
jgi:hypothetical protein